MDFEKRFFKMNDKSNVKIDKYKCWDCHREIKDVNFDDETKKKCAVTPNGYLLIICNSCEEANSISSWKRNFKR